MVLHPSSMVLCYPPTMTGIRFLKEEADLLPDLGCNRPKQANKTFANGSLVGCSCSSCLCNINRFDICLVATRIRGERRTRIYFVTPRADCARLGLWMTAHRVWCEKRGGVFGDAGEGRRHVTFLQRARTHLEDRLRAHTPPRAPPPPPPNFALRLRKRGPLCSTRLVSSPTGICGPPSVT